MTILMVVALLEILKPARAKHEAKDTP